MVFQLLSDHDWMAKFEGMVEFTQSQIGLQDAIAIIERLCAVNARLSEYSKSLSESTFSVRTLHFQTLLSSRTVMA